MSLWTARHLATTARNLLAHKRRLTNAQIEQLIEAIETLAAIEERRRARMYQRQWKRLTVWWPDPRRTRKRRGRVK
jgi:hypothetical protein